MARWKIPEINRGLLGKSSINIKDLPVPRLEWLDDIPEGTMKYSYNNHHFAGLTWLTLMFHHFLRFFPSSWLVPADHLSQDSEGPPVHWLAVSLRRHLGWEHPCFRDTKPITPSSWVRKVSKSARISRFSGWWGLFPYFHGFF